MLQRDRKAACRQPRALGAPAQWLSAIVDAARPSLTLRRSLLDLVHRTKSRLRRRRSLLPVQDAVFDDAFHPFRRDVGGGVEGGAEAAIAADFVPVRDVLVQ